MYTKDICYNIQATPEATHYPTVRTVAARANIIQNKFSAVRFLRS